MFGLTTPVYHFEGPDAAVACVLIICLMITLIWSVESHRTEKFRNRDLPKD